MEMDLWVRLRPLTHHTPLSPCLRGSVLVCDRRDLTVSGLFPHHSEVLISFTSYNETWSNYNSYWTQWLTNTPHNPIVLIYHNRNSSQHSHSNQFTVFLWSPSHKYSYFSHRHYVLIIAISTWKMPHTITITTLRTSAWPQARAFSPKSLLIWAWAACYRRRPGNHYDLTWCR